MKVCRACGNEFHPVRPLQAVCGFMCAKKVVKQDRKAERDSLKKRRDAIKTIPELIKEAQHAVNAYIRARDAGRPCISCGKPPPNPSDYHGGRDAGHFRSVGCASHLRFNEDNIHAQCVKCNQWKAGNAVDYRIRLLERIGEERVIALESNNEPHKWTREELTQIKETYKNKLKELKTV